MPLRSFPGHTGAVGDATFTPDGPCARERAEQHDPYLGPGDRRRDQAHRRVPDEKRVTDDVTPDSKIVAAVASMDARAHLLARNRRARARSGDHSPGQKLYPWRSTTTGHTLAMKSGRRRDVRTWNVDTVALLKTFVGHTAPVDDVVFAPDGGSVLSEATITRCASGRTTRPHDGRIHRGDGRDLVAGDQRDGGVSPPPARGWLRLHRTDTNLEGSRCGRARSARCAVRSSATPTSFTTDAQVSCGSSASPSSESTALVRARRTFPACPRGSSSWERGHNKISRPTIDQRRRSGRPPTPKQRPWRSARSS